jgi:hypothetical protein
MEKDVRNKYLMKLTNNLNIKIFLVILDSRKKNEMIFYLRRTSHKVRSIINFSKILWKQKNSWIK